MEQAKQAIGNFFKNVVKRHMKRIIRVLVIIIFVVFLLSNASVYWLTVDDGTYKEDDWSSTPYAAGQYKGGVSVNEDGTLKNGTTAQELWDKMVENKSRVVEYLEGPEELARLMRAEIITQYPDTRPNPDEKIDWDKMIEDPDLMQGIIKFKRAYSDGNKATMSYVSPQTFQGYIDEYNRTGSETAKNNALSHFTLKKGASGTTSSDSGTGVVAAGDGVMTDISQVIIDATNRTPWPGANWCAKWVNDVYDNAGVGACRHPTAYESAMHHMVSSDRSAIPIGAAVYGTGSASDGAGHIGIYIGGGKVIDSVGSGVKTWNSIDEWVSWQTDVIGGHQGWIGWGWEDGKNTVRGTKDDPNAKQNDGEDSNKKKEDDKKKKDDKDEKDKDDKKQQTQKATEINVDGDGYSQLYTSSAGITYKHFKQFQGSYAGNSYWDGTISDSGCGPSSVAILASGLLGDGYTPGTVAAEMNATYGLTSYNTLKGEMDSLGMLGEVIQSPSAETIQDALRNGKVMLVSVNSNTIFTTISHLMAIVDINEQGQVYICNPGSSSLQGWYDIGEIMKGCQYVITTDAGAAGVASTTNTSSNYTAVVATWRQKDTTITSNDPSVGNSSETQYYMSTTNINYEEMVKPYTMPFDLLWALLVTGEDKNFIFALTDLIYNSDIQITVHDSLTTNTDVDEWHYTKRTKAEVDGIIKANCNGQVATGSVSRHEHDPDPLAPDEEYITTKTVVTQNNTLNIFLTKADVWIVKYENEFTYVGSRKGDTRTSTVTKPDEDYTSQPTSEADSYSCEEIDNIKAELQEQVVTSAKNVDKRETSSAPVPGDSEENAQPEEKTYDVTFEERIHAKRYTRYINIYDNISNTTATQKYVQGVPNFEEKTDKDSKEPNFVTLFNKRAYRLNKNRTLDAARWLFEIIEGNDNIKEMLDLVKYLLYKATGSAYDGIESYDFGAFYPKGLTTVGEGDYIVDIDKSSPEIVIEDVETLKKAFAGYSNSAKLIENAQAFLDMQEKYRVNAVFAAAVSVIETGAGTAGNALDCNNWFNITTSEQPYKTTYNPETGNTYHWKIYPSAKQGIMGFGEFIANPKSSYYFAVGNYTVRTIGLAGYCEDADVENGWVDIVTSTMTQMFNAAGIAPKTSGTSQSGNKIVDAAKSKLGKPYVWAASGPDSFDCSGLTMWCYKQIGINLPHNTEAQKGAAKNVVSVSEARVGDILYTYGHVGIYIGNNQYIHAPTTGDVVKISNNASGAFTHALQFE